MNIQLTELSDGQVIEVRATGKLEAADYDHFVPAVERLIRQHGKVRILFHLHDFHGWSAGALWEDLKFDVHHFNDISRLAIVGDKKWQRGMAAFCKPFTSAEVKFFELDDADEARVWVCEGVEATV